MITHDKALMRCDTYLAGVGWEKVKEQKRNSYTFRTRPDGVYKRRGNNTFYLSIEVKPENAAWDEIIRGIGQCALHQAGIDHKSKPYLVIPKKRFVELQCALVVLDWLGIIAYDDAEVKTVKGAGWAFAEWNYKFGGEYALP